MLQESERVSATKEEHEKVESNFDDNEIYQIENTSLEDTKKT